MTKIKLTESQFERLQFMINELSVRDAKKAAKKSLSSTSSTPEDKAKAAEKLTSLKNKPTPTPPKSNQPTPPKSNQPTPPKNGDVSKRPAAGATDLTEFLTNSGVKFFKVIQKVNNADVEHSFSIEPFVVNGKATGEGNIKDLKSNCEKQSNLGVLLYQNNFTLDFGSCGKVDLNDVYVIKTYSDLNGEPIGVNDLEGHNGKSLDEKSNIFYNLIKGLNDDDHFYFDSEEIKYNGQVINKTNNGLELEISKDGEANALNIEIQLNQNPFHIEKNGDTEKIIFSGIQFKAITNSNGGTDTDKKPFSISITNFDVGGDYKRKKEEPNDETDNKADEEEDEDMSPEELKKAYDMILNDPILKAAFYTQPTFLERLKADIMNKNATGTGISPMLNIVRNYSNKKNVEELDAEFRTKQKITLQPMDDYTIKTDDGKSITFNKNGETLTYVTEKVLGSKPILSDDENYGLKTARKNYFTIELLNKLPDVKFGYSCNVIIYNSSNGQIKKRKEFKFNFKIIVGNKSPGFKPKAEEPKIKSGFTK